MRMSAAHLGETLPNLISWIICFSLLILLFFFVFLFILLLFGFSFVFSALLRYVRLYTYIRMYMYIRCIDIRTDWNRMESPFRRHSS